MTTLSTLLRRSSYWSTQAVVRWQLLLALLVFWAGSAWLRSNYGQDDSNLWLVMRQFLLLLQWTLFLLFSISVIAAVLAWSHFLWGIGNERVEVRISLGDGQKSEAGWVPLTVVIRGPVWRPLLGTVRARLIFSEMRVSESIMLDKDHYGKAGWQRRGIYGRGDTLLHDRGIYDVEKVLISYWDMFGLVSLPYAIPFSHQLYTLPKGQSPVRMPAQPNTTEEQKHRIEIPKRVEGDYVNYKEFESGDNIQRIVWKIYAKSGQLVVRVPEIRDPYASHLYFYASFFDGYGAVGGAFESELLNLYKDKVRNLFEALQRNGYDVRIPHDQEVPKLPGVSEKKNELFQITAASWQNRLTPGAFVQVSKAAFVCASSLTPASELDPLVRNLPPSVPLVVVKLSTAIASPFKVKPGDIFFKPEKQPADDLRRPWMLSSLRRELIRNEKEIQELLKRRGNGWLIHSIELSGRQ